MEYDYLGRASWLLRKGALKPGQQGSFPFPKFATSRQQQEVYQYTDVLCRAMSPFMYRRNSCDLEKKNLFSISIFRLLLLAMLITQELNKPGYHYISSVVKPFLASSKSRWFKKRMKALFKHPPMDFMGSRTFTHFCCTFSVSIEVTGYSTILVSAPSASLALINCRCYREQERAH